MACPGRFSSIIVSCVTWRRLLLHVPAAALLGLALGGGSVAAEPAPLSATGEGIYAAARPQLLQIRTLVEAAGRQSSIGSGFLVSADGLADHQLPRRVAIRARARDLPARIRHRRRQPWRARAARHRRRQRSRGGAPRSQRRALLRLRSSARSTARCPRASGSIPMGNPLDLGFTIVEGTYNGLVERSYNRAHPFLGRDQSRHERRPDA